jgi:hypothetical protein
MHDSCRSGIFAEPSVHAAVIAPLQGDVDAVVGDMVACFTRIASLLEARSRNRRSNMQASAAESPYVNSGRAADGQQHSLPPWSQ